jgi:serine/threonine protein kinase
MDGTLEPSGSEGSLGEWEKSRIVGKGGSSTVFKGKLLKTGQVVAIKQIEISDSKGDTIMGIQREIEMMKGLQHNNILKYFGSQTAAAQNKVFIFLEYSSRGSLRQYYLKKGRFSSTQVSFCTKQIVLGLEYLHDHGIAHRDVKCANCLLFRGNNIKLADFGASKQIESTSIISGLKGTPHWMAPEVSKSVHSAFLFSLVVRPLLYQTLQADKQS